MKNLKKIILSIVFVFAVSLSFAQSGPSEPPDGGPSGGGPPVGGNAHIGGGLCILLTISLAYGGKKLYKLMSESEEGVEA